MDIKDMTKPYVVVVHNHKWGHYFKQFDKKKEAEQYVNSICADMNTYCFLYKLVSINNSKQ